MVGEGHNGNRRVPLCYNTLPNNYGGPLSQKDVINIKNIKILFNIQKDVLMQGKCCVPIRKNRTSHQRCSIKKGVLKNFTKFTGTQLYSKRDSGTVVFL